MSFAGEFSITLPMRAAISSNVFELSMVGSLQQSSRLGQCRLAWKSSRRKLARPVRVGANAKRRHDRIGDGKPRRHGAVQRRCRTRIVRDNGVMELTRTRRVHTNHCLYIVFTHWHTTCCLTDPGMVSAFPLSQQEESMATTMCSRKSLAALALGALLPTAGLAQAPAPAPAPEPEFTFTANVGLFSQYVFRGLTQTNEKPAIQGGFDLAHKSGFYVGTWASNISWVEGRLFQSAQSAARTRR
jgi:hypothetical protein